MEANRSVYVERDGPVLVVTIDRPHVRNAIDGAVAEGLAAALDELDGDPMLRSAVLAGAGGGFSAGMDLKAFKNGERPYARDRGFAGIVERPSTKPLVAAIEGFAVAGGLEVALACDIIVAARDARLGIPEVKRGLVAAGGALLRLPARVGHGAAMQLALTGELIEGEQAQAIGLVDHVTDPGEALGTALRLAVAIAENAPLALQATKRVLLEAADWAHTEKFDRQRSIVEPVFRSDDAQEGAAAFMEKRAPIWRGI